MKQELGRIGENILYLVNEGDSNLLEYQGRIIFDLSRPDTVIFPYPQDICDKIQAVINENNGIRPPKDFYKQEVNGIQAIKNEANEYWETDESKGGGGWEFENGARCWIKGADFPLRGFVDHEIIWHINIIKRFIVGQVKLISWRVLPSLILIILSKKETARVASVFADMLWKIAAGKKSIIMRENNLSTQRYNLMFFTFLLMVKLGIEEPVADKLSLIISHIFEYDNAYYLRLGDMMNEVNQTRLSLKPTAELRRLKKLVSERDFYIYRRDGYDDILVDNKVMRKKVGSFFNIAMVALLIPKFRKALRSTLKEVDLSLMKMDDNERYWACHRTDYLFMGMTSEARKKYAKKKGWNLVEPSFKLK